MYVRTCVRAYVRKYARTYVPPTMPWTEIWILTREKCGAAVTKQDKFQVDLDMFSIKLTNTQKLINVL